ncbi:TIGR03943 family putative permease subunit [Paenibacillus sp. 481]|uniref:TIGR03943 family putative permease subunit n=1 Tax=Paenibacillus sp. 481 TaxID=2835869 RepID=UPI001E3F19CF|nr:TIGR03943 family protein [Paenibacillus sp. 481]UHA73051.1 TIGR03943 family protein [Paenibacillus sp. 481]
MSVRSGTISMWLQAGTCIGWSLFITVLSTTNQLQLYISPSMTRYVKWTALGCYILGAALILIGWLTRAESKPDAAHEHLHVGCACGTDTPQPNKNGRVLLTSVILLAPIGMSLIWPAEALDSKVAENKGIQFQPSAVVLPQATGKQAEPKPQNSASVAPTAPIQSDTQSSKTSQMPEFPADEFTQMYADYAKQIYVQDEIFIEDNHFMETIMTLDLFREQFTGKRITWQGFVYQSDDMKKGRYAISRFVMQCCTADAAPFGLLIDNKTKRQLKKDSWVEVSGKMTIGKQGEAAVIVMQVDRITSIPKKEDPYVYHNLDFGI